MTKIITSKKKVSLKKKTDILKKKKNRLVQILFSNDEDCEILSNKPSKEKNFSWDLSPISNLNEVKTNKSISIEDYLSKPDIVFNGDTFFGEFMGIELEVELRDGSPRNVGELVYDSRKLLNDSGKFCIFKRDGSLKNNGYGGFEICSSPASLDFHRKKWQKFFSELPAGMNVSDKCGMHVHISKKRNTPYGRVNVYSHLQLGKIVGFLHNPKNRDFIALIAGRGEKKHSVFGTKTIAFAKEKYQEYFNHYSALNITHAETIEFRIFASTTNYNIFCKNLEFCHALIRFCFPANCSIKDSQSKERFLFFVKKNRKFYPFLSSFLADYGFKKFIPKMREDTQTYPVK